ncbi:MAG: hypothetical protein HY815_31110, partial [Candidatus Riflebacteria bacterium]|nr:hypothetical protein [Candidatus Riflebacteria bacterium]
MKVLKDGAPVDFVERYTRELAITNRLAGHASVLRYHDVDVIGKRYCVICDHWDKPSLESLLARRQRLSYPVTLTVIKALARLLEAAQMEGVAERHLRTEDLLVDPVTGETRAIKFSIPRANHATVRGLRNPSAGVTGDLYFLGCMLYRLLVLDHPFRGRDQNTPAAVERLEHALKGHYPDLGAQEVSRLTTLFKRCATTDLGSRVMTYDDVVREIENLECLNAQILKSRRFAEAVERKRRRKSFLQTAFDTVAALRGDLAPPADCVEESCHAVAHRRAAPASRDDGRHRVGGAA